MCSLLTVTFMDEDVYKLRRGFDVEATLDTGHYVKTDGTIGSKADSRIYTYSVTPGEVVRAYVVEMGQPLGASASIVSLWNGGTFVEDVRSTSADLSPSWTSRFRGDRREAVMLNGRKVFSKPVEVHHPGSHPRPTMFNERYAQMYMVEATSAICRACADVLTDIR